MIEGYTGFFFYSVTDFYCFDNDWLTLSLPLGHPLKLYSPLLVGPILIDFPFEKLMNICFFI